MENINHEAYIDEVIATAVDVEPGAMYYVLERMENGIKATSDSTEKDSMLAAYVDEIIAGIEQSFKDQFRVNELSHDFVWFESPMDQWIDSQPEMKNAFKNMTEPVRKNLSHDFVW
ncbi:MAG: hypothetical protein GXY49_08750, partial [Syntrophomonadaceae bacterium]|nr:hypothetical protein [Syntrophomonadaceae bacterium]